jgi:phospholipase/lecithinase/hemolysin
MRSLSLVCLFALSASVTAYDKIIAFADSLTDNGNDYKYSKFPSSPPYWRGRFSNGPTWLDEVTKQMPNTTVINRGFGGATTDSAYTYPEYNHFKVPGLLQEIADYPVPGDESSLFIIFIGYNDLNSLINPTLYTVTTPLTKEIIADNVMKGIKNIEEKYHGKQFLVMIAPPFDKWPVVKDADKAKANELVTSYNALLKTKLDKLTHVEIKIADIHAWFEEATANPGQFGLRTDNGPCVPDIVQPVACSDPNTHFFWDLYHPNTKVHKALGEWATKLIKESFPSKNQTKQ